MAPHEAKPDDFYPNPNIPNVEDDQEEQDYNDLWEELGFNEPMQDIVRLGDFYAEPLHFEIEIVEESFDLDDLPPLVTDTGTQTEEDAFDIPVIMEPDMDKNMGKDASESGGWKVQQMLRKLRRWWTLSRIWGAVVLFMSMSWVSESPWLLAMSALILSLQVYESVSVRNSISLLNSRIDDIERRVLELEAAVR